MYGLAADLDADPNTTEAVQDLVDAAIGAFATGLFPYSGHAHVDWR